MTDGFEVQMVAALSLCLIALVMDRLTDEVALWITQFADDIAIFVEIREQVKRVSESCVIEEQQSE